MAEQEQTLATVDQRVLTLELKVELLARQMQEILDALIPKPTEGNWPLNDPPKPGDK